MYVSRHLDGLIFFIASITYYMDSRVSTAVKMSTYTSSIYTHGLGVILVFFFPYTQFLQQIQKLDKCNSFLFDQITVENDKYIMVDDRQPDRRAGLIACEVRQTS